MSSTCYINIYQFINYVEFNRVIITIMSCGDNYTVKFELQLIEPDMESKYDLSMCKNNLCIYM